MKVGVGLHKDLSNHTSTARNAAADALRQLEGQKPDILFVFSSVAYDQKAVLAGVHDKAEGTLVVGCSAAGEITAKKTDMESVVVMAIAAPAIRFTARYGEGVSRDSFAAGAEAAKAVLQAAGEDTVRLFIMIPDGMTGNGADILRGVQSVLGENFPIIGGSAGDDFRFQKTYEYCEERLLTDAVIGIGLSGDFSFGFGIRIAGQALRRLGYSLQGGAGAAAGTAAGTAAASAEFAR